MLFIAITNVINVEVYLDHYFVMKIFEIYLNNYKLEQVKIRIQLIVIGQPKSVFYIKRVNTETNNK